MPSKRLADQQRLACERHDDAYGAASSFAKEGGAPVLSGDVRDLLAAIREFHWLRSRQHGGEQTTSGERRLRELRDLLEPRGAATTVRNRVEFPVNEPASVTVGGGSQSVRVKRLGLRRVELETTPQLPSGEQVVLSVRKRSDSYHFHARVLRSNRRGSATVEILSASIVD
jgi:hypothetical protein